MNLRLKLCSILAICVLALIARPPLIAHAQPKVSGRITGGFQAPTSTDTKGRRHVLKGNSAEPRGKDLYELTDPRVTSYDAQDAPEMFIESPRCFYEMKQNFAYSDATLSVRTADGKFSIEGLGWRWNPEAADLVISNNVLAFIQKAALATNVALTSTKAKTNVPVRITAASFLQQADTASFIGNVMVQDGDDTLRCKRLNIHFAKPDGVQVIEAIDDFELRQGLNIVRSGRASYNLKEGIIRITEKPQWESEGRSGVADMFVFKRAEGTGFAEGNVFMKLPLTNITDAAAVTNSVPSTNLLQIYSDKFRFYEAQSNRLASAFYEGRVRGLYTDATISAQAINVAFNSSNRVERIIAENEVIIESRGDKVFGKRAEYELAEDKILLTGDPRWEHERGTGRSGTLIFYPKTKEALALNGVEMIFTGQTLGAAFGVTNRSSLSSPPRPARPFLRPAEGIRPGEEVSQMVVRAETFSRGTNVAVFHKDVVVADAHGRISSQILTLGFGPTNQVQRILAEHSVRIEQPGFTATGERADYNAATGLVHLTGNPRLVKDDTSLTAQAFIIDRNKNTFSVAPGHYRIEMKLKEGAQPVSVSPIKRNR